MYGAGCYYSTDSFSVFARDLWDFICHTPEWDPECVLQSLRQAGFREGKETDGRVRYPRRKADLLYNSKVP